MLIRILEWPEYDKINLVYLSYPIKSNLQVVFQIDSYRSTEKDCYVEWKTNPHLGGKSIYYLSFYHNFLCGEVCDGVYF